MSNTSLLGAFGGQGNSALMFRNKVINGNFDIWQRGTSQTSSGYGSDDRWKNENGSSTKTHSQQAFTLGQTEVPGNPTYFSRTAITTVVAASAYVRKLQRIEDIRQFSGQEVTLSFWAKASITKDIVVELSATADGTGAFGADGNVDLTKKITLSTAWTKYTITCTFPSISGWTLGANNNLQLAFWFEADNGNYQTRLLGLGQPVNGTQYSVDIAQVQLEAGPTATPFERRPIGVEQSLCSRYFQVYTASANQSSIGCGRQTSTTSSRLFLQYPTMRIGPTMAFGGTVYVDVPAGVLTVSSISNQFSGVSGGMFDIAHSSGGAIGYGVGIQIATGTANFISLSAEL